MSTDRRSSAGGDFITRYAEGSACRLRIDTTHEKAGWRARQTSNGPEPTFPGTAVLFEDQYYELLAVSPLGERFAYDLGPWDDRFPFRGLVSYSPEDVARAANERDATARSRRARTALFWTAPLIGLLPGEDQRAIEREHGLSAAFTTGCSAITVAIPSAVLFVLSSASVVGRLMGMDTHGEGFQEWQPVWGYLMIESVARLGLTLGGMHGVGSIAVVAPVWLLRRAQEIRRRLRARYSSSISISTGK